jgi:hypothetical protein
MEERERKKKVISPSKRGEITKRRRLNGERCSQRNTYGSDACP